MLMLFVAKCNMVYSHAKPLSRKANQFLVNILKNFAPWRLCVRDFGETDAGLRDNAYARE
jgi:hypothetical protein